MSNQYSNTFRVVMYHPHTHTAGLTVYVAGTRAKAEAEAHRLNSSAPNGGTLRYEVAPAQ